jgi:formamidopyrimidine-DNA glycosylase
VPEGPEVAVIADAIKVGCPEIFEAAEIVENVPGKLHRYSRQKIENWDKLQKRWLLSDVGVKGKLILFEIITHDNKKLFGLTTLGMSGTYAWNSAGHKHCRFAFIRQRGDLSFCDQRCFGTFRLATPSKVKEIVNKIGWDLLKKPAPEKLWETFQHHRKIKNKEIGVALMDQSLFSGIGNIYKCETMYALGIDPFIKVSKLSSSKWAQINQKAHEILVKAYELGGSSVKDYTYDGKEGQAQEILRIYASAYCPEGHPIQTAKQGSGSNQRTTWYCKVCQS